MVEVILEAGITHGGSLKVAQELADSALKEGGKIVKYQTFRPEKLVRENDPNRSLLEKLALSYKDFVVLSKHCENIGIEFLSTPGDVDSLKFLVEECGIKRIKIGSDDLCYKPLIDAAAHTRLPIILSTGMATLAEIDETLIWIFDSLPNHPYDITLLHCVSLYPCPSNKANIRALHTLELNFPESGLGYSDHCTSFIPSYMAVALGAEIIEKHICPDGYNGPDYEVSLIPLEIRLFLEGLKHCEEILGPGGKEPWPEELENKKKFRKDKDGYRSNEG